MRQRHLHDEERLDARDATPGAVVFARVMSHPWWPAVIGRCPASGAWQNNGLHRWVFFLNDDNGAWLRLADLRPYGDWNKETVLELNARNARFHKFDERIATACTFAEELIAVEPLDIDADTLARFSPSLTPSAIAPVDDDGIEPLLDGPPPAPTGPSAVDDFDADLPTTNGAGHSHSPPSPLSDDTLHDDDAEDVAPSLRDSVSPSIDVDLSPPSPEDIVILEETLVDEPMPVAQPPVDVAMTDGRPKRKRTKSTRLNGFVDPNEPRTRPGKSRIDAGDSRRNGESGAPPVSRPACPLRLPLTRDALYKSTEESDSIDIYFERDYDEHSEADNEQPKDISPAILIEDPEPAPKLLMKEKKNRVKNEKSKGKSPLVVRFRKELVERVQEAARNGQRKVQVDQEENVEDDEVTNDEVPKLIVRRSTRTSAAAAKNTSPTKPASTAKAGPSKVGRPASKNAAASNTKGRKSPRKAKNNKRSAANSTPQPTNVDAGDPDPNTGAINTHDAPVSPPPSKRRRIGAARATVNAARPAREDDETDTDGEEDLVRRFLPTPHRDTAARLLLAEDVAAMNGVPSHSFGNNIHPMADTWAALLNRVAALEQEVKAMRRERAQSLANLLGRDPESANFKTSVEVVYILARNFVEARKHDAAAINAGIRLLWPPSPPTETPEPGAPEREVVRQLAISSIWQYFSKTVGDAQRDSAPSTE